MNLLDDPEDFKRARAAEKAWKVMPTSGYRTQIDPAAVRAWTWSTADDAATAARLVEQIRQLGTVLDEANVPQNHTLDALHYWSRQQFLAATSRPIERSILRLIQRSHNHDRVPRR